MNDNKVFARQLDLIKPSDLDFPIAVIGAGGIGSWATLALAKMGCRQLNVYDFDKVEDKNIPAQIYSFGDIGHYKTEALKFLVQRLTDIQINTFTSRFQELNAFSYKVIICAVDSLEERRKIWAKITEKKPLDFDMFIDVRMAKELIKIHIVSPFSSYSIDRYLRSIDRSIPAYEEPCTARSVVYNTFMCGGLIANLVKKYAKKEDVKTTITFDIKNLTIL